MIGLESWRKTLVRGCAALLCLAVGSAAAAMTYRDNTVDIPITASGYTNVWATYTIKEFSIPSGQDPNGHIKAGLVNSFYGNSGHLTYSIGRSGSTQVAQWWSTRIAPSQNTYNHNPGELNFAFTGRLVITLMGGVLGDNKDTYTLDTIALAQGHAGATNNWWFGGANCTTDTTASNTVKCRGTSTAGWPVYFYFQRGPNGVSTVALTKIEYPPYDMYPLQSEYLGESTRCAWQPLEVCPPFVTYYNGVQQATLKLTVRDNFLYNSLGKLFDTKEAEDSGAAIFVMDGSSNIYASNAVKKYMFHHSTIMAGASVASAGDLEVKGGIIETMSNCSGHYRPPAQAYEQLVEGLHRQGYTRPFAFIACPPPFPRQ